MCNIAPERLLFDAPGGVERDARRLAPGVGHGDRAVVLVVLGGPGAAGVDHRERLAEVAQGVIVRHRENLGVQFKLAVNDHRWAEAARLGDTIISEFPNTQMAAEVRSMIDVLRTRATQAALAAQVK